VAFPFALANPTFWLETAGAVYRAEVDQLPETCRDWYSIQHAAGVSDGHRSVLWATHEAPLVQLGGIHSGQWAHHLDAPIGHLYAWLMNNLYFTNFKAAQGGSMSFSFSFAARSGPLDADLVGRWGERAALPLAARVVGGAAPMRPPLLRVESPDLTAVSLSLDPDGRSVRFRLQASSRGAESVTLGWTGTRRLRAWRADVFGNRAAQLVGDGRAFELQLAPHELTTIVVEPIDSTAPVSAS
jgi:alpha-mannosidase